MTPSLEQAFAEASKLPELQQNQLAQWLLDEILSEQKWNRLFAESEDLLRTLAEEALAKYQEQLDSLKNDRTLTLMQRWQQFRENRPNEWKDVDFSEIRDHSLGRNIEL
jgi:hypothetical protein